MIYANGRDEVEVTEDEHRYVTFHVGDGWLGIPVERVQEVLTAQEISPIPIAPEEVAGFLNLRGQIVTAVDLRTRLGLPPAGDGRQELANVVVRDGGELFSLLVDEVGDVVEVLPGMEEETPPTLELHWRKVCEGVVQLDEGLLVLVEAGELLEVTPVGAGGE